MNPPSDRRANTFFLYSTTPSLPTAALARLLPKNGPVSTEMISHVFESFAQAAGVTLHVDSIRGVNNHHMCVPSSLLSPMRASAARPGGLARRSTSFNLYLYTSTPFRQ